MNGVQNRTRVIAFFSFGAITGAILTVVFSNACLFNEWASRESSLRNSADDFCSALLSRDYEGGRSWVFLEKEASGLSDSRHLAFQSEDEYKDYVDGLETGELLIGVNAGSVRVTRMTFQEGYWFGRTSTQLVDDSGQVSGELEIAWIENKPGVWRVLDL